LVLQGPYPLVALRLGLDLVLRRPIETAAGKYRLERRLVNFSQVVVLLLDVAHASQGFSEALTEALRFDLIRFLARGMS